MHHPPLGSGGNSLRRSRDMGDDDGPPLSPIDSDSDSDISLGTHSPVPSMSLQNSPSSTSGCNDKSDRLDDRDHDNSFRSFSSLNSFRFGDHIPGGLMPGKNQTLNLSKMSMCCVLI